MTTHEHKQAFVGQPIRRFEDPALVTGRGRFSGDLAAAHWVRFVRSPVASGRIVGITVPPGARVITAADVGELPPITPMLHKFNYVPIAQPILAKDVVRFVGEPVAAVVASSREAAEDVADEVAVEIEETTPVVDAMAALDERAAPVHPGCPGKRHRRGPGDDSGLRRRRRRRAA